MLNFRAKIGRLNLSVLEAGVIYFFIYGFIGWLMDSVYGSFLAGQIVLGGMFKSFLLPIPFAPIYGFGALVIILFRKPLWDKHPLLSVPLIGLIATTVEYFGGVITVALFHHRAWDYSGNFLNLQGHISLFYAILWMALGWAFIKFIHPAVEKTVDRFLVGVKGEERKPLDKNKRAR